MEPLGLNVTIGGRACSVINFDPLRDGDDTPCPDILTCLPRQEHRAIIQCIVPMGEGRNQEVVISVNDRKSEARLFNYDPPVLQSVVVQDDGTALEGGWSTRGTADTQKWAWVKGVWRCHVEPGARTGMWPLLAVWDPLTPPVGVSAQASTLGSTPGS